MWIEGLLGFLAAQWVVSAGSYFSFDPTFIYIHGVDPNQILQGDSMGPIGQQSQLSEEQLNQSVEFLSLVLGDTEATWSEIFEEELGSTYIDPKLVLFTGAVESACGLAIASMDDEMIKFNMPTALLPEGVREGYVLEISITRDEKATEDSKAEVSSSMERLKRKNQEGSGLIQDPEE